VQEKKVPPSRFEMFKYLGYRDKSKHLEKDTRWLTR